MVVEYIRSTVSADRGEEFESTRSEAFVVRIEWSSLQDHERDFPASAALGQFFEAVKPFFEQIEEMRHYQPIAIRGTR